MGKSAADPPSGRGKRVTQGCPCGFYGDLVKSCGCPPTLVRRYVARVSGPLMDRIDLYLEVPAVRYRELTAIARLGLSARAYHRVLKIARTIADLMGSAAILPPHVAEAIQYRTLDRGVQR